MILKGEVRTTLVSTVDLETFETDHTVEVFTEDLPSEELAKAVAIGACLSALEALGHSVPLQ